MPHSSTVEHRLECFLAGQDWPATELSADEARRAGIRLHRSAWGHTVVEAGAVCASVRLAVADRVFIGAHSYMNDAGYLRGPLFVGRYCSIGRRVSLGAATHDRTGLSTSPHFRTCSGSDYAQEEAIALFGRSATRVHAGATVIGHDVWIGDGAVVGAGVRIGHGAVIGANTVVTRDVPPYAIVRAGAGHSRSRFPTEVATRLLACAWWEADPRLLRDLPARHVLETLAALESRPLPPLPQPSFRLQAAPPG